MATPFSSHHAGGQTGTDFPSDLPTTPLQVSDFQMESMSLRQDPKQSTDQIEAEGLVRGEPKTAGFVKKLVAIVEDPETDSIVSWSRTRDSFVIWDFHDFSKNILPLYFKHNNFSSFNAQLNSYGFRKIEFDRWEFMNPGFQQGKKHLLKNIKRKANKKEVGKRGLEAKVEVLEKDRDALRSDVVKLREQQDYYMARFAAAEERLTRAESLLHETNSKKQKVGEEGQLEEKCSRVNVMESGQGADSVAKDDPSEGLATKLYKIFVELDDLWTKPSDLEAEAEAGFQSLPT